MNYTQGLCPYKLINNKGIWYLVALDDENIEIFSFTTISHFQVSQSNFIPDDKLSKLIVDDNSVWFSTNKYKIVLSISKEVADYFYRRTLIANQAIEKSLRTEA